LTGLGLWLSPGGVLEEPSIPPEAVLKNIHTPGVFALQALLQCTALGLTGRRFDLHTTS
jgi:hypothetical protein